MGFNQYLLLECRIGRFGQPDGEQVVRQVVEAAGLDQVRHLSDSNVFVSVECAYWREAWQIHSWMELRSPQGALAGGQPIYASEDDLYELCDLCTELLESRDPELANARLPTGEPEDVAQPRYWEQLENTVEMLTQSLEDAGKLDQCYFKYIGL